MSTRVRRITWMHIVSFAFATAVSYVLGVLSSLIFPVLGAPGVSALYVAAAVYVPLGIWMGMWGALAGYFSCLFLGLYPSGYSLVQSAVWAFADFIEALVPAAAYRLLKVDPDFTLRRPRYAKLLPAFVVGGTVLLLLGIVVQVLWGATLGEPFVTFYVYAVYIGTALAAIGIIMGMLAGDPKTWGLYVVAGIILPAVLSGIWGSATLTIANFPPPLPAELFFPILVGWITGDLIVLAVIATAMLVALTPVVKRTAIYVERWFA